ncbi:5-amino-6-(5-phospho-D-ribitylamino)uracil phosphatase, chloroplastic [Impatiens glandulifera]|uniref:5-amino-6-(5-phospho-D-ribitylamino)uracil phosphatase, chloroplastic n=1 Tax=Impatiens glandulifera TaxID=253017 RepID=UPI001FB1602C|nr:5-amino-6-(5-phospho-D-ribitylamino)uracil phosphatase, chloroplastic [Impatiens glandulifera]
MVESIAAATSLLGHRPICGGFCFKYVSAKTRPLLLLSSSPSLRSRSRFVVKSQATELTKKEAFKSREGDLRRSVSGLDRKPMLWPPENRADNSSLHNPLLRQERMGCGWLSAIFEWEGVLIEDNPELEKQAWLVLSQEEGKSPPPAFILSRIEGMKTEQAITEVLCWSRDTSQVKRMANRKEEIYQGFQGGIYRFRPGSEEFVNVLLNQKIPMALVSTRPREVLETAIGSIGIEGVFTVIVAAEDVHRGKPDPEMFMYAAQLLSFIPDRCIVFGNSNQTVEAAHDARMKCVAVASKHPVYELAAADMVVRRLDELTIVDLKNLADLESPEFGSGEPELEMEMEAEDEPGSSTSIATLDDFW